MLNDVKIAFINANELQVIEDHRPFNTDVSIETFFKRCSIMLSLTRDAEMFHPSPFHYICRYRLMSLSKRKVVIEPVMDEERRAIQLLSTPAKSTNSLKTPKTPTSLVKRMSRVSLSEQKNWSVSKTDGTKLLLKRAILADRTEKDSPKKNTTRTPKKSISESLKLVPKINKNNIDEIISMELKENSDDEIPTLIIRQHVPTTPKRKTSVVKTNDETPKKVLLFEDDEKMPYSTTRSGRVTKHPVSYIDNETSPVKRTPRRTRKVTESDDDFKPAPKTPKTPRTKTPVVTPKRSVSRRIVSQMTPTLRNRAHSVENIDGNFYTLLNTWLQFLFGR